MSTIDPIATPDDRPSLKSFQEEVETAHSSALKQRHTAPSAAAGGAADGLAQEVDRLTLEDAAALEMDDGRLVKDRLQHSTDTNMKALASLLERTLERRHGELILQLSPSNLEQTNLAAVVEPVSIASTPASPDEIVSPQAEVDTLLSTFRQAAVGAEVTVLHNPFDVKGKLKADEGVKLTETVSAVNDEEAEKRWRATALRLLVRRKPDGAEQLIETRVTVVGNVPPHQEAASTASPFLSSKRFDPATIEQGIKDRLVPTVPSEGDVELRRSRREARSADQRYADLRSRRSRPWKREAVASRRSRSWRREGVENHRCKATGACAGKWKRQSQVSPVCPLDP